MVPCDHIHACDHKGTYVMVNSYPDMLAKL